MEFQQEVNTKMKTHVNLMNFLHVLIIWIQKNMSLATITIILSLIVEESVLQINIKKIIHQTKLKVKVFILSSERPECKRS